MWVCVVIVFSVVGWAWFRQTQKQFVALLHPEQAEEARVLAEQEKQNAPQSPFSAVFSSFKNIRANISELFVDFNDGMPNAAPSKTENVPPNKLPIAE